jgi:hypothetical protein
VKMTLTAAALLWTFTLAWPGQPGPTPPNWGQTDLSDWTCPQFYPNPTPQFVVLPVSVALTTTGGPVLVSLGLNSFNTAGSGARLLVDLTVDGVPVGTAVDWNLMSGGGLDALTRIVPVTSGAHTFGVSIACNASGNVFTIERAWLAAYELPAIPK